MNRIVQMSAPLNGELEPAKDKSISHRAVLFSALADGESIVKDFLIADDTLSTLRCLQGLGVSIKLERTTVMVKGAGLGGLREPAGVLDCGNSGTTMRLLTGVLAAQNFFSVLSGDASLNNRPMGRVVKPLMLMGADIKGRAQDSMPPLAISGQKLKGITYYMPIPSAQVKSALLLAGLEADGNTVIDETYPSRDHSERMLKAMGAALETDGTRIILHPGRELDPQEFTVPGDVSSAAFFMVAGSVVQGSDLLIKSVGINPTRTGIISVLERMGADIRLENCNIIAGEPIADIAVKSAMLKGTTIQPEEIPSLIDELPVLAVAMAVAEGESRVSGAGELRVKETDRIAVISSELSRIGAEIEELEDGFIVKGSGGVLKGGRVDSHGDHRIAMSLAIAGLVSRGETEICNAEAVSISYPEFWDILKQLVG